MVERPNNDPDYRHLKTFVTGEIKLLFDRIEEVNARVTKAGEVCAAIQKRIEALESVGNDDPPAENGAVT